MYRRASSAGLMFALLAAPAVAASAEEAVLEPTTQWRVDYGEERCSLLRQFGPANDGVLLEIASFGSRTNFGFTLIGQTIPRSPGPTGQLKLRFTPDEKDRQIDALRGMAANKAPAALFSAAFATFDEKDERMAKLSPRQERLDLVAVRDRPEADFEEKTTTIAVKLGGKHIVLHTGKMTKPLAALRSCVGNMDGSWGLDPATQDTLSRDPVLIPSTIKAIQANYPTDMLNGGLSAYVPVRVMVDAAGNAGACVVQSDGVDPAFKKAVCEGLTSRFKPALDAQGQPVDSVYTTAVIFRIG